MIQAMHQTLISFGTIILYIFSLSIINLTGFFIFINYFFRFRLTEKKDRFLFYSLGWMLGIIGTAIFLIYMYGEGIVASFAYISSGILFSLGTLFICIGIISYFTPIKMKYYLLISILFIIIPPIFKAIFGSSGVALTLNTEKIIVYLFLIFIGIKHRQKVITYSKVSYFLFIVGISLSLLMLIATEYVLQSDLLVILYFGLECWVTVILIIFLIHLEHNISIQDKYLLKDAYSHDLANKMQKIMGFIDLSLMTKDLIQCENAQEVLIEANNLLLQIRNL